MSKKNRHNYRCSRIFCKSCKKHQIKISTLKSCDQGIPRNKPQKQSSGILIISENLIFLNTGSKTKLNSINLSLCDLARTVPSLGNLPFFMAAIKTKQKTKHHPKWRIKKADWKQYPHLIQNGFDKIQHLKLLIQM